MVPRRLAATVLALAATAVGGCGGGGGGEGEAREQAIARQAASFRTASTRTCQDTVQRTSVALARFDGRVEAAAETGDADALRAEVLRYLDDLERAVQPYLARPDGVPPPEGAEVWHDITALAADRFVASVDAARAVVGRVDPTTTTGRDELQEQLSAVGPAIEAANTEADAIYDRYGVVDCLSATLAKALLGRGA